MDLLYSDPRRFSLSIALLTNWVSERNLSLVTCHVVDLPSELLYLFTRKFSAISCMALSWLVLLTCIFLIDTCLCATCVHEFDDSTHESPLPNACTHSTFSIDASLFISLVLSTCIMSIDTCLLAICERGLDDSSHVSPLHLPTTCIHSTFSIVARLLFGIFSILIVATCLEVHSALGLDDFVYNSPLPTACTSSTLAFAIVLLLLLSDLSVTESSTDSTLTSAVFTGSHAMAGCLSKSEGHFAVSLLLFSMECISSGLCHVHWCNLHLCQVHFWYLRFRSGFEKPAFTIFALALCLSHLS